MPSVYVDFDDVLCYTTVHFLSILEREFGRHVPYEQVVDFDWGKWCGLQDEELSHLFAVAHEPDELLKIEPREGALSALKVMRTRGFECVVVTGRPSTAFEASLAWLKRHGILHAGLMIVDKYGRYPGVEGCVGLRELAAREFCFAVEDSLEVAGFLAEQMSVPVALIDCPWNRRDSGHKLITRHRDWASICGALPDQS